MEYNKISKLRTT